ncbi:class I SAM-dependent methyltransferase [Parafrigoribacterium humi]|uniref:class I SAM-dependent methyltransferase n=1 Tax=Parafrigoribacterium humi TaxID=3144664 RepID=UPI0032EEB4E3
MTGGNVGAFGSAEFWEEFYGESGPWTGNPNAALVTELRERPLVPGTALDLACGTGGDAIWLANAGWRVTGVDISSAALKTAATAAEAAGAGADIRWQQHDLETDFPEGSWDLVNVAYLHSPIALNRERILQSAAGAVAPDGTLIIIGHQGTREWPSSDTGHTHGQQHHAEQAHSIHVLPTIDEVLAKLDLDGWQIVHIGNVTVTRATHDGTPSTHVDNVIRLQRA